MATTVNIHGEQLAEGVRNLSINVDQPTVELNFHDGQNEVIPVGPRTYRIELTCNEVVFVDVYNRVMRDSKNHPDPFALQRHVEVPE